MATLQVVRSPDRTSKPEAHVVRLGTKLLKTQKIINIINISQAAARRRPVKTRFCREKIKPRGGLNTPQPPFKAVKAAFKPQTQPKGCTASSRSDGLLKAEIAGNGSKFGESEGLAFKRRESQNLTFQLVSP